MLTLRTPTAAKSIANPDLRLLVEQRFVEMSAGEPFDADHHGYMIVFEPGDTVVALDKESSIPILRNLFDDSQYGDPDFAPVFEALEEHASCYEMVFILNDDGFGIEVFIPKVAGIDDALLAMCAEYAVPAMA